jgi:hypothetical protein
MEIAITRDVEEDESGLFRAPILRFILLYDILFLEEDRWIIDHERLHHHLILDRTPRWYAAARRQCEREEATAKAAGKRYDWPEHVPRTPYPEWILTVDTALRNPIYIVRFKTAEDREHLEPQLTAAFEEFAQFMRRHGSRPRTIRRRL